MTITTKSKNNGVTRAAMKELYKAAFPRKEQLPWWLLRLWDAWRRGKLTAYYDGETFCGFTVTVTTRDTLYVMFFAVAGDIRGQGYGSGILEYIKQNNPDKTIFLVAELPDIAAPNYGQRIKRLAFYQKNGFQDTGWNGREVGGWFRVLSTTGTITAEDYRRVFMKLTFGLWRPKITKVMTE